MIIDELDELVERGRKGENRGLFTGMDNLDEHINGIQKGTYYLFGGNTGTGKTAFVDDFFVLKPYDLIQRGESEGFTLHVFYWSLEIDKLRKIAKWVAHKIWRDEGEIYSMKDILSIGKHTMDDRLHSLYKEKVDYFDAMLRDTVMYMDNVDSNPTGIYKAVKKYCDANGQMHTFKKEVKGMEVDQKVYIPNRPKEVVLLIVDHIGLIKTEREYGKKAKIDKLSEYCIILRNTYGVSPVLISQFNRSLADVDRQRFRELTPQLEDFKETGNTQEDANVVCTLFDPSRYNMSTYAGYTLDVNTASRFRSISLLKNRDGDDGIRLGLNFMGENGWFRELPPGVNMQERHYSAMQNFTELT